MRIPEGASLEQTPSSRPMGRRAAVGLAGWAVAGIGLVAGLLLTDAPAWAYVMTTAIWLAAIWLRRAPWSESLNGLPVASSAPSGSSPDENPPGMPAFSASEGVSGKEGAAALAEACGAQALVDTMDPQSEALKEAEQDVLRYALSHDLRAPLRVIDGFTRIVKEDYGRHLDRLGNDHLERVLAASARMNGMIDALLAQAQLAAAPLARQEVDLSALVQDVATELAAVRTADGGVAVQLEVQRDLITQADALLVRRVVENLVGNAIKYSAKVEAPCVRFGCMPLTNPPVYFVRDNGAGFDMQHADKLFGMFQRLHSAKDFEGSGVGLAGVRNIIRRHGGRVWAEAQPGQGACFYFTLMGTVEAQQRTFESV